jgi:NitT/TauT family transport system substrate-binding protein
MEEQTISNPEVVIQTQKSNLPESTKHKKSFWVFFVVCIVIILLSLILLLVYKKLTSPLSTQQKMYPGKITLSTSPWPGYIGFYIAQEEGYFKKEGVDVTLKTYIDQNQEAQDYASGKIQANGNVNLLAVQASLNRFSHQAVLVIDSSNGADGIVAAPGITEFSQIKGKKVGYEFGDSLSAYFLEYALSQNNMTLADITSVNLDVARAVNELIEKRVDVAVTYEPYLSEALTEAKANKIYSSSDTPRLIDDVLTFNKNFIDSYPDSVSAILRAYFEGITFLQQHPQESYQIFAKEFNTTPQEVETQLKEIKILSLQENKNAFSFSSGEESIYGNFRNISKFISTKESSKEFDTDTIVNGAFIKKINSH